MSKHYLVSALLVLFAFKTYGKYKEKLVDLEDHHIEHLKKLRDSYDHNEDLDEEIILEIKDEYLEKLHELRAPKKQPDNTQRVAMNNFIESEKGRAKEFYREQRAHLDQFEKIEL